MGHQWTDKVVLITGAATGIGALVVRLTLEEGAKHVAVLDINETAGVSLQEELNSEYGADRVTYYTCDVTNEKRLVTVFQAVKDRHGYLDVVINNAGIANDSRDTYKKMIDINLTALITGSIKGMDLMSIVGGGRGGTIINISSTGAFLNVPILPIYCATKSAILHFSNTLGIPEYFLKTGVRVIAMCFGPTDTPILHLKNVGCFHEDIQAHLPELLKAVSCQKPESAAKGLIEAYKQGESGSTWIAVNDKPAEDITDSIEKANEITRGRIFE